MAKKGSAPRFCAAFGGRTLVLHGKGDLRLEEHPRPRALDDFEVLIAPRSVGICGSDMHYYKDAAIGGKAIPFPGCHATCFGGVLGHEASGEILEVGRKVSNLSAGDRVAIEPGQPCGLCKTCLNGRYNLCASVRFLGSYLSDCSGALCEQMVHDSRFCFKLPDHISYDAAALLEPMSVGLYACRRGHVSIGTRVLVCGAGPVGLMAVICAKVAGASFVGCTDISDERLKMAMQLGADAIYNVTVDASREKVPTDWGVALECSGAATSLNLALDCVERGGRIVLVGMGKYDVECRKVQLKELDLVGMFRYANTYPAALSILASGQIDVKAMITHHFDLSSAPQAFRALQEDRTAIKILIHPTSSLSQSNKGSIDCLAERGGQEQVASAPPPPPPFCRDA